MFKNRFARLCAVVATLLFFASIAFSTHGKDSLAGENSTSITQQPIQKLTIAKSAILGVVEGLTEYLPVSSTGHLIITGYFMGLVHYSDKSGPLGKVLDKDRMEAINSFDIVIQLGAILAVVGLYRNRIGQMCAGLAGKDMQGLKLFLLLTIAFLPAAIVGLAMHKKIEANLFGPVPVAWALAVGGVLMIVMEFVYRRQKFAKARVDSLDMITYWQAFIIGLAQVLAMWPGTSRSMITILAALLVGINMLAAAEFSFLLALPTLTGATVISAAQDWRVLNQVVGIDGMLVGLVVSGVVAALAIKWFIKWLTKHGLTPFGIYRIAAAIFLLWLLAF